MIMFAKSMTKFDKETKTLVWYNDKFNESGIC